AEEDDAEVIAWYAEDFVRFFGRHLNGSRPPRLLGASELRALEPEERMRHLHAVAVAVNGLPPGAGLDRLRRYVEMYRINQGAARSYRPRGVYPGSVVIFRAADAAGGPPVDADPGWGAWVGGGVSVQPVPGAHDTFIGEPHVASLAEELRLRLDRVCGDSGGGTMQEDDDGPTVYKGG